jgi:outer membrane biosynthesis protein TonB
MPKTMAAAAAGAGNATEAGSEIPEIDLSNQFITSCVKATIAASEAPSASMSAAVEEPQVEAPQVETFDPEAAGAPRIAVDPMMAEGAPSASKGTSFSEISELPPLKEVYVAPPPPPPVFEPTPPPKQSSTMFQGTAKRDEKPKVQPKEVAEKAIQEIKSVPPSLYAYSIGGALALILAIGIGVTVYVHSQNSDDDSGAGRPATAVNSAPEVSQPAPSAAPPPAATQPADTPAPEAAPVEPAASPKARTHRKASPPPPVIIPGQLAVDSTPTGAQVQLDGKTDPSWVTPLSLTSLQPGQHAITVTKPGYAPDSRTVDVASANRATVVVHLAQLMATLVVHSDPPGANIYIDGRDMGAKTPGQVSVDKGQHVVLVRKMGYVDETISQQFILGQTFNFSPTLRALGNVDDIRTVGKMSKLFGGKGAQAGQATVSIHTQPKGAQVAINQRVLDKNSPVDVALDPGNYMIDITLTGYAPVHRVISADKGGKVVVDEVLQKQ